MLFNIALGFWQPYPTIGKNYTSEHPKFLTTSTHLNCAIKYMSTNSNAAFCIFKTKYQHIHLFLLNRSILPFLNISQLYFFSHSVIRIFSILTCWQFCNNFGKYHHCFFPVVRSQNCSASNSDHIKSVFLFLQNNFYFLLI